MSAFLIADRRYDIIYARCIGVFAEVNLEGQTEADVEIEQEQPIVTLQEDDGQPAVNIDRQEPSVTFEEAEPNVEVNSDGQANVRFTESGEPNVNVEEQVDGASENNGDAATQQAAEQAAAQEAGEDGRGETGEANQTQTFPVESVLNRMVITQAQEEVGTIERIVTDGEEVYAVFTQGGFFGLGASEASVPVSVLSVGPDREYLILRGMTEDELDAMPNVNLSATRDVAADQQIELSTF